MTVRDKLIDYLVKRGMFPEDANEILLVFDLTQKEMLPDYHITYSSPCDDYPDAVYLVWSLELNRLALQWIDANCPRAWYRMMFL